MTLALVGVSHLDVELAELEHLSGVAHELPDELLRTQLSSGAVILSTCNRVELYLDAPDPHAAARAAQEWFSLPGVDLAGRARVRFNDDVARHLFAVSAGLESMVVGEAEIAGQVRSAITEARRDGTVTARLDRLFGAASRASRQVASTTGLGTAGRSVVSVALDLVEDHYGSVTDKTVCLIGTGSFARIAYAELSRRNVGNLLLYSLSGRAQRFAETHPGTVIPQAELASALARADVVVSCSGAPHTVIDAASLAPLVAGRERPMALLDLALTRDIDADISQVPNADLITLDDVGRHAPLAHIEAMTRARRVVDQAVDTFAMIEAGRSADPVIVALREHVFAAMQREGERAERKHSQSTALAITGALDRFANELLHVPMVRARALIQQGRSDEVFDALDLLFGLSLPHDLPKDGPSV
ncbi:MAG: glutamyl-tRNA reductase [Nitriliruptoraceae bacterium]